MRVILWMLVFTGFIYAVMGLQKHSEQEKINKKLKIQNTIDSLQHHIDSLQYVNDSIIERYQLFDVEPVNNMIDIMNAIMEVESNNNDSAYRANEDAVGCLQIRKCMVNDVNRILKRRKSTLKFTYNDRWSRDKSIYMFEIYCNYYGLKTAEEIARCWNGGPRGINNPATVRYWNKVKDQINS
jgi:hypothetical protein